MTYAGRGRAVGELPIVMGRPRLTFPDIQSPVDNLVNIGFGMSAATAEFDAFFTHPLDGFEIGSRRHAGRKHQQDAIDGTAVNVQRWVVDKFLVLHPHAFPSP